MTAYQVKCWSSSVYDELTLILILFIGSWGAQFFGLLLDAVQCQGNSYDIAIVTSCWTWSEATPWQFLQIPVPVYECLWFTNLSSSATTGVTNELNLMYKIVWAPPYQSPKDSLRSHFTELGFCLEPLRIHTVHHTISSSLQSNVFMYYGLSNFYQNHRRYVKSRDDSQLNGDLSSLKV